MVESSIFGTVQGSWDVLPIFTSFPLNNSSGRDHHFFPSTLSTVSPIMRILRHLFGAAS